MKCDACDTQHCDECGCVPTRCECPASIRRPTAAVTIRPDRWEVRCECGWWWSRLSEASARNMARLHAASCGLCVSGGREYMDRCACANCQRRRKATS